MPLGKYHLCELILKFQYFDAIVVDTPIVDHQVSRTILAVEDIQLRLIRARAFLRYLDKCAECLAGTTGESLWNRIHNAVAGEITDIEIRAMSD